MSNWIDESNEIAELIAFTVTSEVIEIIESVANIEISEPIELVERSGQIGQLQQVVPRGLIVFLRLILMFLHRRLLILLPQEG